MSGAVHILVYIHDGADQRRQRIFFPEPKKDRFGVVFQRHENLTQSPAYICNSANE